MQITQPWTSTTVPFASLRAADKSRAPQEHCTVLSDMRPVAGIGEHSDLWRNKDAGKEAVRGYRRCGACQDWNKLRLPVEWNVRYAVDN